MVFPVNFKDGCIIELIFAVVGIFFVSIITLQISFRVIYHLRLFVFARLCPPNMSQYGSWAVITGATDGIGKSYAHELARRGINIVLVSRNADKLILTARELEGEYGVLVEVVQADFSKGWELYGAIREKLKDKDIGILVNNVGTVEEGPQRFVSRKEGSFVKMVTINMDSVLIMTSIVLPQMVEKNKGAVINISSLASIFILPFSVCYGATKAATNVLSNSLYYEYKSSDIVFQTLIPSYVNTKLISFGHGWDKFGPMIPDAETYCRSAAVTFGYSNLTTGYWFHELWYTVRFLPASMWSFLYSTVIARNLKHQIRPKFDYGETIFNI